jgi:hypothetical protein
MRGAGDEVSQRNIIKAKKQLAIAKLAAQGRIDFNQPIFSWQYILAHGGSSPRLGQPFVEQLEQTHHQLLPYFNFSWSNYLLYNVRFLLRGNPLFIFQNPDKIVLQKIRSGLAEHPSLSQLYEEMRQIIFPIIIF